MIDKIREGIIWWLNVGTDVTEGWHYCQAFNVWHFVYLFGIIGLVLGGYFLLRKRSVRTQDLVIKILCICFVSSYALDFLIQPLLGSDLEHDFTLTIDKLPFHFCTLMGVLAPFVTFNKKCKWAKTAVVAVAMTSTMMYMTYPGTALDYAFFAYKVRQTMFYHGTLFAWAVYNVGFGFADLKFKESWKAGVLFFINLCWASFGHLLFNHHGHSWNWCFIAHDSFGVGLPDAAMFPIVLAAVSLVCAMLYGIVAIVRICQKKMNIEYPDNSNFVRE